MVESANSTGRRNPVTLSLVVLVLGASLLGWFGCGTADQDNDQHARPTRPSSDTATPSSQSATPSSQSATPSSQSASPSSQSASASSQSMSPNSEPADYLDTSSGGNLECFTFYPNGTVEVYYSGASTPTDRGRYQGDANGGQIIWDSGRTSSVVLQGGSVIINGHAVSAIDTCTP